MTHEWTAQDPGGRSLRAAMRGGGRLRPEAVRRIGLALLDAIGAAHARGLVHLDLSPERVVLAGPAGAVELLGVGAGSVPGTVSYLAPEQLVGTSNVDERADLWAAGVMLYELLAGALPYRASNLGEMMSALALSEPVPIQVHLPGVDASVLAFFARALARDRSRRFASAHDMARALAAAAIETAAPPPQTMGGMPTTASGVLDPGRGRAGRRIAATMDAPVPVRAAETMVRPPAAAAHPRAPRPAAEQRWSALALAAVAVVAIVAGVVTIATSGGAGAVAAAVAPDRSSAPALEAEPPRAEIACAPEVQPAMGALFMYANEAPCVQARSKAPPAGARLDRSR